MLKTRGTNNTLKELSVCCEKSKQPSQAFVLARMKIEMGKTHTIQEEIAILCIDEGTKHQMTLLVMRKQRGFARGIHEARRIPEKNNNFRIKIDLSCFNGHLHVESFLNWMLEVENFFEYMQIPEAQQVKLVAYKLCGGASTWWEQLQNNMRRQGKQPVRVWPNMK
ncbi:hypothetical protein CIPAW_05G240600 [Carya illinoinensis]|uniref:Retrotransposon gag domain-containing protein n=1 Tax=Carya illinoinensis TaxID=32201 RepID=A0A8T1QMT3_CARIL|nr:hypothetical protein CIPAW_05G240600 [Carya illinoinensis]